MPGHTPCLSVPKLHAKLKRVPLTGREQLFMSTAGVKHDLGPVMALLTAGSGA